MKTQNRIVFGALLVLGIGAQFTVPTQAAVALEAQEVLIKGYTINHNLGVPLTTVYSIVKSKDTQAWDGVQLMPATADVAKYLAWQIKAGEVKTCKVVGTDVYTANVRGVNTVSRMVYELYGCD